RAYSAIGRCVMACGPAPPASSVHEQLAIRGVLRRSGLLRQPEDALADDVALYLVGPAVDRRPGREERHLLHEPFARRVLAEDHAVGADDLVADLALQPQEVAHHQLRNVRLGAGALVRRLRAQRRIPAELLHGVEPGQLLAHVRVLVLAELLRELDEARCGEQAAPTGAAGTDLADVVAGAVLQLPGERAGKRVAGCARAARAETGALGHQRRVGSRPSVVETADD